MGTARYIDQVDRALAAARTCLHPTGLQQPPGSNDTTRQPPALYRATYEKNATEKLIHTAPRSRLQHFLIENGKLPELGTETLIPMASSLASQNL